MKKKKYIPDFDDIPSKRKSMQSLSLEERKLNFDRVELGYTVEEAQAEARRCLSCRQCIGCALCMAECKERAIVLKQKAEKLDVEVDSIILAPGFEAFDPQNKPEMGYNRYYNIITSVELERMLSPNGPYSGLVLRPWDGNVAQTIAFIQCVGSREEFIGANYCSSVCCDQAIKQALQIEDKDSKAEVKIFIRDDMRPLGKGSEEYFQEALQKPGFKVIRGEVIKLDEDKGTKNIIVEYARNGKSEKEVFDLAVLSVGLWAPTSARALKNITGIRLNKYSFCTTDTFNPEKSSQAGIFASGSFTEPKNIRDSVTLASAAASQVVAYLRQQGELDSPCADTEDKCLIIGSSPAGLKAAKTFADCGFQAVLVEHNKELGGGLKDRYFAIAEDEIKEGFKKLIEEVKTNNNITIYTDSHLANINASNGIFKAKISKQDGKADIKAGAIIVATGAEEYNPKEFSYESEDKVITQSQLAQLLEKKEFSPSSIAMIQCVGCRNAERPYCSRICCVEALQNALKIKELKPECKISILHKGMRVFGFEEELLTEAQEKDIEFIKLLDDPQLIKDDELKIKCQEEKGRKTLFFSPDLVVLSNAIIPHNINEKLSTLLGIPLSEQNFFHSIDEVLRPLESSRPGVYLCGLSLWPATLKECMSQGSGAAIKACQRLRKISLAKSNKKT
jgi:heterodisulfide reductase subunit A-like polyferredoxin